MKTLAAVLAGLAALAVGAIPALAQTPVRFASVGGLTDAGLYLAEDLGYFKEAGVSVSMKRMANAPDLVTALATDQLDVAGMAITPGLFAAAQQGIAIRIVGDKQSIAPGVAATRLTARTDIAKGSSSETIKSLKGRSIAVSARASSSYYHVVQLLGAQGIKLEDVKIVQLAYPQMIPALTGKAVEAAYLIEPFLSKAIHDKLVVDIGHAGDHNTSGQAWTSVPLVYSEKFAANRKAAQAFMTAYMKGVRVYNDAFVKGIGKDKAVEIMAKHSGMPKEVIAGSFPSGLDPNQEISIDALRQMMQFFIEQKLMTGSVDFDKLVDMSFAKASIAELGRYK